MRGNIRVFCRIRPLLKDEKESCILAQNDQIRVENKLEDKVKFFEYDRVFPHNITQVCKNINKINISFIYFKIRLNFSMKLNL